MNRIKQLRQKLGMSQQAFAQAVHVSLNTVYKWEADKAQPSRLALEKINALEKKAG